MSLIGGIMAGVGLAGSAMSAGAATDAAHAQMSAADKAAQLEQQYRQNSLDFQKDVWNTDQKNLAPWLQGGKMGLSQLEMLMGLSGDPNAPGYGSLMQDFKAPTAAQAAATPGYQFQLSQGLGALQNQAAAKGNIFSGNTQEALNNYAQNFAQTDYNNVYNQAFNTFETNQANKYNRLAALSGAGQQAANTLGAQGQNAAGNIGSINANAGAQIGQDYNNYGAAQASGYVGSANAWNGGINNATNSLMNMFMLQQMGGI